MRNGKRALAGVAAGALGLALIPFVATTSAQAAGTITGTTTPVRYTATSGLETTVPAAAVTWPTSASNVFSGSPSIYFDGTTASGASLYIYQANGTAYSPAQSIPVLDDTPLLASAYGVLGDDSFIRLKVDAAGTYSGRIANGDDTVSFSFTTTGAAATISLTPASQSTLVGGTADLTVALLDGAGNPTQPTTSSQVNLAVTGAGGTLSDSSLGVSDLALGSADIEVSAMASGSSTVTATGAGDLLTQSATATITASGSVSDDTVQTMSVTAPSTGVWNDAAALTAKAGPFTSQVRAGTTSLTVSIDDSIYNTYPIGLKITPSAGGSVTVGSESGTNGAPLLVEVTPVSGVATADLTLGGAAALAGGSVEIQQVDVNGNAIDGVTNLTITQVVPTVYQSGITVTPNGYAIAQLGATTSVTVSVDDSLGDPAAGQLIRAYRTSSSDPANLLSFASTGSDGSAVVTVSGASGLVDGDNETYVFNVSGLNGTGGDATDNLVITYTTSGGATTLSAIGNNRSDADLGDNCSTDATVGCTLDDIAMISVPFSGTLDDSTDATYNMTAGTNTGAVGNWTVFKITTDPADSATVTVPTGAKVSATEPTSGTTLWSAGETSATISADSNGVGYVYVWATAVGTHDVTIEAGGLTVTQKIHVVTDADAAYNIALSPADQTVGSGAITTVTLTVTDVFGNPVDTTDDTGYVTITASGEVLLAGFAVSNSFQTGTDGTATVTVIAGNSAGTGALAATPASGDAAPAWQPNYPAPTGAPAPVTSAAATVQVSGTPTTQSITITGERGVVRDRPGIIVDGVTEGFGLGAILRPWVKFPGQTSYTLGTKEILVDQDGEFMWQRRTGKKIYIIIKSEDESVRSNRIIIPAK